MSFRQRRSALTALLGACITMSGAFALSCGDDDSATNTTDDGGTEGGGPSGGVLSGASHSTTLALSNDDKRLVTTNFETKTVSVFAVEYAASATPKITKKAEIEVGEEPQGVVVHPNGKQAFVILRKDQKLVRIDDLDTDKPVKGAEVKVGSEPTGLALTPTGKTAWVANFSDGTLMGIDTSGMAVKETVDLNATIAASGLLGAVKPRPALAHPRGLAITNNGDANDEDESIFVTEYLPIQKFPVKDDGSNYDVVRVGAVYKVPIATKQGSVIEIPPLLDTGFKDTNGEARGCSLSQAENITIHGAFGYVSSLCMSVKGPSLVNYGPFFNECSTDPECPGGAAGSCSAGACTTNCTADAECGFGGKCTANACEPNVSNPKLAVNAVVSVIDLGGNKSVGTANLNNQFWKYYEKNGVPDNAARRIPSYPIDVGLIPGTSTGFFVGRSVDALFRVDFNATYQTQLVDAVGDPKAQTHFVDLAPGGVDPNTQGHIPTGIVVANGPHEGASGADKTVRYGFVNNLTSRNVSVVDLYAHEVAGKSVGRPVVAESTAQPTDQVGKDLLQGRFFWTTALTRWSYRGQGWYGGCFGCHGDMQGDDSPWIFTGPHQAPRITGSFNKKDPNFEKLQDWVADLDELEDDDFAFQFIQGWVGAIISEDKNDPSVSIPYYLYGQFGLVGCARCAADPSNPAGMPVANVVNDWSKMRLWARDGIRTPSRPSTLDPAKVAAGKQLFIEGNCHGCHGGTNWTIAARPYTPEPTGQLSAKLQEMNWADEVAASGLPLDVLPTKTKALATMRTPQSVIDALYYEDEIVCVLRDVGTCNVAEPGMGIADLDSDMASPGLGCKTHKGFAPPSLLGLPGGGACFHAAQARTLESTFTETFARHFRALNKTFLAADDPKRAEKVEALIQFLLSIDDDEPTIPIPPLGPQGGMFCRAPTL